ncbi:unnamed protein product [Mytilus coruscus]|uniref:Uncharacterized protein n=1 Tax=Mytilus coruscus TaxID=42192 RepID=A0A6J8AIV3_MYTCO|nr:unnamed protein product [Mytilus coruscus]
MSPKTCVENPQTYEVYQLECRYSGSGVYSFDGPATVKKNNNRQNDREAHIRIAPENDNLEEIDILSGSMSVCAFVSTTAVVKVDDRICMGCTTVTDSTKLNVQTHDYTKGQATESSTTTLAMTSSTKKEIRKKTQQMTTTEKPQHYTTDEATPQMPKSLTSTSEIPVPDADITPWIVSTIVGFAGEKKEQLQKFQIPILTVALNFEISGDVMYSLMAIMAVVIAFRQMIAVIRNALKMHHYLPSS